jgi:hypothetical protein
MMHKTTEECDMANPNMVKQNAAKNPYEPHRSHRNEDAAEFDAAALRADGWQVRVTRVTHRMRGMTMHSYNVWKRRK